MKIDYIKKAYRLKAVQKDLCFDGINLMSINITANHKKFYGSGLNEKQIKNYVNFFREVLREENNIEEWNQTS